MENGNMGGTTLREVMPTTAWHGKIADTGLMDDNYAASTRKSHEVGNFLSWGFFGSALWFFRRSIKRSIVDVLWRLEAVACTLLRFAEYAPDITKWTWDVHQRSRVGSNQKQFSAGTTIGRYCSIDATVRAFAASHPTTTRSSHAFFYNPMLGYAMKDLLNRTRLTIGNDVFMGYNVL